METKRIRKLYIGVDIKDCLCWSVGQRLRDGSEINLIDYVEDDERFDIYTLKDEISQVWKDYYKSAVISKEYFTD